MAEIPLKVARPQLSSGGVVQYPSGSPVGGAIEQAGNRLVAIGNRWQEQQDQADNFKLQIAKQELNETLAGQEQQLAQGMPADGAGFAESFVGQLDPNNPGMATKPGAFDETAKIIGDKLPASVRGRFDALLPVYRQSFANSSARLEMNQRQGWYRNELGKLATGLENSIAQSDPNDPKRFEGFRKQGEDAINASGLNAQEKQELVTKWRQNAAEAFFQGMVARDPEKARAALGIQDAPRRMAGPVSANVGGVYQGLQARGLSSMHAAVAAGNVQQESGGNPRSHNAKEDANGIIQWRGDRWENLKNFAAGSGRDPHDINVQLDYLLWEGKNSPNPKDRQAFNRFLAADTPEAANRALKGYIRYGDDSEGTRLANAIAIAGGKGMNAGQGPTRANAATLQSTTPTGETIGAPAPEFADLSLDQRLRLANQAESAIRTMQAQRSAALQDGIADYSAYLRAGNQPDGRYQVGQLQEALGPEKGQAVADQLQQDAAYGADVARVKWATPEELQQIVSGRESLLSSPDEFRENAQNLAGLSAVIKQRNAEIVADPAVYVQQSPQAQASYQKMTAAMSNPALPAAARQAAINQYANTSLGLQSQLGVPAEEQRILPKAAASDIARQFSDQSEGGQNAATLMRSLEAQWGKQWPKVFEQLAKDGELPGTALVVGAMNRPDQARAAEQLAEAAKAGKKSFEDILPTEDKSVISDELAGAMQDFQGTLVNNPGWAKTFGTFRDGVELLALSYVSQGDAPAQAVARAYDDVLGKKYEIVGTYRVPKEYGADPISTGAELALRELNGGLRLPTSLLGLDTAETEKQYLSALKAQGFWVTSPDESGLTLYDGTRRAVVKADGSPLSLTWDELNQKAAGQAIDAVTGTAKTGRILEQGPQLYPGQAAEPVQQQPGTENYPILKNVKPYRP